MSKIMNLQKTSCREALELWDPQKLEFSTKRNCNPQILLTKGRLTALFHLRAGRRKYEHRNFTFLCYLHRAFFNNL